MKAISPAALQEEHCTWPFLWSIWKSEHSIFCHCQLWKIGLSPPWELAAESAVAPQALAHWRLRLRAGAGFFRSKQNLNALAADGKRKWKCTWVRDGGVGATVSELLWATEGLSTLITVIVPKLFSANLFAYFPHQKDNASPLSHRQFFSCKRWGARWTFRATHTSAKKQTTAAI